ncbi:MAG: glycosyltransferase family 4 protein [Bacteroidota bacterium]|nr:glycosyltransferase family 4 protein [Bacteroidota bacterium]
MESILVFRKYFYYPSETFIYRQVQYLKKEFKIFLLAGGFADEHKFDFTHVHKVLLSKYERKLNEIFYKIFKKNIDPEFSFPHPFQITRLIRKRKIHLIHAHFGTEAVKLIPLAKNKRIPLVVTFHGFDASKALSNESYKRLLPSLFDYASRIIIVSNHMFNTLNLYEWKDKVVLLPCSIDSEEFKPFEKLQRDNKIKLLHSGRIVSKKGVPDLIAVFANVYKKNKKLQLTVIGDGPQLAICKQQVNELFLSEAVIFLGAQKHSVVKAELNEADIFVLNSRTDESGDMEGTPVTLLEAMSMEKAVVSTYHAGIPDVVKDDFNGKLVEEKDNDALQDAIEELIQNEEKRKTLGKEARKTVINKYSDKRVLPILKQTLTDVIKEVHQKSTCPL